MIAFGSPPPEEDGGFSAFIDITASDPFRQEPVTTADPFGQNVKALGIDLKN